MLNKYKFILGTIFYMGVQYISHAEQINFQGSISEFTCTHQSKDPLCQNIQIALSNIKTKQDNRNNESYKKSDHVSNIIEQNLDQHHKIIILSYH
ncbi:hypothetical protein [Acinetobacter johnsonii]|uniref:hypothetical protein n=1 Tax=Acinetobacter johnsonii TaxID=40214 RepID=UPI0037C3ED4E